MIVPISSSSPAILAAPSELPDATVDRQRADSLTIADIYGAVPAAVLTTPPIIYEAINPQPGAVTPVARVARIVPAEDSLAFFIDAYA